MELFNAIVVMLIQKIFHVHQNLEETKVRLASVRGYRRALAGVEKAVITADGVGQFDFALSHGLHAHFVLVELPTPDPDQVLFRSTAGNMHLSGLIEFFPIKDDLTEVQITVQYAFKSPMHAIIDAMSHTVEQFLHQQLRRLQAHFDGMPAPVLHEAALAH